MAAFRNPSGNARNEKVLQLYECASHGNVEKLKAHLRETYTHIDLKNMNGFSALLMATELGNLTAIETLIAAKADLNIVKSRRTFKSPLIIAIENNDKKCLEALVKGGADVNACYDGYTPMKLALRERSVGCAVALVRAGFEPDTVDFFGRTALLMASEKGDRDAVKELIKAGANPNIVDKEGKSALLGTLLTLQFHTTFDLKSSREECARVLIEAGAKPDLALESGCTALMMASKLGNITLVRALVEAGANLDIQDKEGNSSLLLALKGGLRAPESYPKCAFFLITAGTKPDLKDNSGHTALMMASKLGNESLVRALIQAGASLNIQDNQGNSSLIFALKEGSKVYDKSSFVKCAHILINAGAKPDLMDRSGYTALMLASKLGSDSLVRALVEAGANLDIQDGEGNSSLLLTLSDGCKVSGSSFSECAHILIQAGAKPDLQGRFGRTALMMASELKIIDIVKALVQVGASPNIQDTEGSSSLLFALKNGKKAYDPASHGIVQVLLQAGAKTDLMDSSNQTALIIVLRMGEVNILRTLVQAGVNPNMQDKEGNSALMLIAAEKLITQKSDCTQILVKAGADLNLVDSCGETALMKASQCGNIDVVRIVIQAGADLNIQDNLGKTALIHTAEKSMSLAQSEQCAQVLLQAGANHNLTDTNGRTALMVASEVGHKHIIQRLIEAGAALNMRDKNGRSALIYATENVYRLPYKEKSALCLLKAGSYPDLADSAGRTPLMIASAKGHSGIICSLIQAGSNVNNQDGEGRTALIYIIDRSVKTSSSQLSLERESRIHPHLNNMHMTLYGSNYSTGYSHAWTFVTSSNLQSSQFDLEHEICTRVLLESGAQPDLSDRFGCTALMRASELGEVSFIKACFQAGAAPDVQDNEGRSALIYAARAGQTKCELLIDHNADVNIQDNEGKTVLMYTTKTTCLPVLLWRGADTDTMDRLQCTVLDYFLKREHCESGVTLLLRNGIDPLVNPHSRSLITQICQTHISDKFSLQHSSISRVSKRNKHLIRLIVCNGIVDIFPKRLWTLNSTPLSSVLDYDVAKYFIANCYLTEPDLKEMREDSRSETTGFLRMCFSQPWPLVKLSFIAVSTVLGPCPGREERIKQTQLPARIQRMLMFQEPISRLPVCDWANIPLCFDPVKYETLPNPRPLLYYWPFGRDMAHLFTEAASHIDVDRRKAMVARIILRQLARIGAVASDLPEIFKHSTEMVKPDTYLMDDEGEGLFFDAEDCS